MRWLRWLLLVLALVAALVVAAVVALNRVDWSAYQDPLIEQVRAATGRELAIEGPLRVHVGLRPAVSVAGVRLANAPWAERGQMLEVDRLEVQLALLPLLFGTLEVPRVVLEGLEVWLEVDAQGRANWEFEPAEGAPPPPSEPEVPSEPAPGTPLSAWLGELRVEQAQLVYRDARGEGETRVRIDRLTAASHGPDDPIDLALAAHYGDEPLELEGRVEGLARLGEGSPLDLALALSAGGATVELEGRIAQPLSGAGLDLALAARGTSLAELSGLAGTDLPPLGPWSLAAALSDPQGAYRAQNLRLAVGESEITGSATARLSGARPALDVDLSSPRLRLADFSTGADEAAAGAPTPGDGAEPGENAAPGRRIPDDPLPFDALGSADAEVALAIASLEVSPTLEVQTLAASLVLDDRRLTLEPLSFRLAGGSVTTALSVDARQSPPRSELALEAAQLDLGTLLAALEISDRASGAPLDLSATLRGRGDTARQIASRADGEVELVIGSGKLDDRWLEWLYAGVVSQLLGTERAQVGDLNCVVGRVALRGGEGQLTGFAIDTPPLGAVGSGGFSLGEERIEMRVEPVVKKVRAGAVTPAARVHGPLFAPAVELARNALLGGALATALRLAEGKQAVSDKEIRTPPGPPGCEKLISRAARLREREAGAPGSASDALTRGIQDLSEGHQGKASKKLKKNVKKLEEGLGDLLGR